MSVDPRPAFLVTCIVFSWFVPTAVGDHESVKTLTKKMHWVDAESPAALCNDFTRAGFFINRNSESNQWIVFLEGGGTCSDVRSCNRRFFDEKVVTTGKKGELLNHR